MWSHEKAATARISVRHRGGWDIPDLSVRLLSGLLTMSSCLTLPEDSGKQSDFGDKEAVGGVISLSRAGKEF